MNNKMSAAVLAAAAAASSAPSEDRLQRVRDSLSRARDLSVEIAALSELLDEKQGELTKMCTEELPSLFEEVGIDSLGLEPRGNLPGYDAKLKPYYSAKLPEDERREAAFKRFKWLTELTRNTFTIKFGRGDSAKVKKLLSFLKKEKITNFENKVGVLPQSLTAEIRRRFDDGQPLPPADLELLGAYVGTVVEIKQRKEK